MFDITVTERCQMILADHISEGDLAIDCTAGNGHDTLFLAKTVGSSGKVLAFDVQRSALENTKKRLADNGISSSFVTIPYAADPTATGADTNRVELIWDSHENISKYCSSELNDPTLFPQPPSVIMFNLGYLPGGDHTSFTTTESTINAVTDAIHLVRNGGIVSVITYPGHKEGAAEDRNLSRLFSDLDPAKFEVLFIGQHNRKKSPNLYLILKK